MNQTFDDPNGSPYREQIEPAAPPADQPRILAVDTDHALLGLIEEWVGVCNCIVESDQDRRSKPGEEKHPYALLIVDVPHPRRGGIELLQRLAAEHPGTPIIALSSTFFSGIESNGGVARTLGVACVLPKPVARESLITAVRSLLRR
jgi:DNA-binding response OmpR family regulator